ncbi:c-type cytochrome [Nitrosophilus alvini]|uniref:c-type cytochrome n=1 Tax=Nitrosophilus alvini TaxID=2714855 RepID=UPI00190AEE4E|nr:c-type cytochrome [Nitrosophilus alvini]
MKKLVIVSLLICMASAQMDLTQKGKILFEKYNCNICHKPKDDAASIGPSLETIAIHYLGNERQLVEFLKGNAKPIIDPQRFEIMKPQLYKTKHMFEEDYRALSYFLTSVHKNR